MLPGHAFHRISINSLPKSPQKREESLLQSKPIYVTIDLHPSEWNRRRDFLFSELRLGSESSSGQTHLFKPEWMRACCHCGSACYYTHCMWRQLSRQHLWLTDAFVCSWAEQINCTLLLLIHNYTEGGGVCGGRFIPTLYSLKGIDLFLPLWD